MRTRRALTIFCQWGGRGRGRGRKRHSRRGPSPSSIARVDARCAQRKSRRWLTGYLPAQLARFWASFVVPRCRRRSIRTSVGHRWISMAPLDTYPRRISGKHVRIRARARIYVHARRSLKYAHPAMHPCMRDLIAPCRGIAPSAAPSAPIAALLQGHSYFAYDRSRRRRRPRGPLPEAVLALCLISRNPRSIPEYFN